MIPKYNQQAATLHSLFIYFKLLYIFFRRFVHPSSGAQNCIYSICYLSDQYCYLPLSWRSWKWVPTLPR